MCATNIPGNERSLVIRLIAGDEDAFCELYGSPVNSSGVMHKF
jgi:RNA polymerase sigma-70 factor (ECF subfamily)